MKEIQYPEGFIPLDIFVSSISKNRRSTDVTDSNKRINYGSTYGDRDVELTFLLKSPNTLDYRLLRDKTYELFGQSDAFYVVEEYQRGKRLKVSVDETYIPERLQGDQKHATGSVTCKVVDLPFFESIGTSMDIHNNGITTNDELWGFGMGLEAVDETLKYKHIVRSENTFRIFNPSNIPELHPFECDLKITFTRVIGSSKNFQINNLTNGSRFWTNVGIGYNDTLVVDNHLVTRNNLNILRDTGRSFIWLSPGWNTFRVLPQFAIGATIEFDFPFRYL